MRFNIYCKKTIVSENNLYDFLWKQLHQPTPTNHDTLLNNWKTSLVAETHCALGQEQVSTEVCLIRSPEMKKMYKMLKSLFCDTLRVVCVFHCKSNKIFDTTGVRMKKNIILKTLVALTIFKPYCFQLVWKFVTIYLWSNWVCWR